NGIKTYLPRIGLKMGIPDGLEKVTWFGTGPGESYSDSCQAAMVDLYSKGVDELYMPYVVPQENGNRTGIRWVSFATPHGIGFKVSSGALFSFSAHRFDVTDFDAATHTSDLVPREYITVNIDHAQRGIGSASCGPELLPKYEVKPEPFKFDVEWAPLTGNE
ncbi:MAG: beta-galactosidase subunit alpha, partial [Lentisphaerae bacterium]|nr:beta-galactosidase subunit alpha [Lentisphaerota bacterium]